MKDLKLSSVLWKWDNIQSCFCFCFSLLYCSKVFLKHFYYFRFPLCSLGSSSCYSEFYTDSILDTWYCNLFFNYVNVTEIVSSFTYYLMLNKTKQNIWLRVKCRYERSSLYEYLETHYLYNMRINVTKIRALRDHFLF